MKSTPIAVALFAISLAGCLPTEKPQPVKFETDYQAVFLQGGQVFFGKLEGLETQRPVLRNVYQVRQQINAETKQVANVLVKRNVSEPHAPDMMILNASQIVFVEPVASASAVAKFLSAPAADAGK